MKHIKTYNSFKLNEELDINIDGAAAQNIIEEISPDIIHFEEIPETFCNVEIIYKIYNKDRKYKIFETSHGIQFNIECKIVLPDKFLFVSEYQKKIF